LDCDCKTKVNETIQRKISDAKKVEYEQNKKLDQFQDGIREGATANISKKIYNLSIFMTSKAYDCRRDISSDQILTVLDQQIAKIPEIALFYAENRAKILDYNPSENIMSILRKLTRKKETAPGLLEARKNQDLEVIKKSLQKLKQLEKSLEVWKEGIRRESKVEPIVITDMHF